MDRDRTPQMAIELGVGHAIGLLGHVEKRLLEQRGSGEARTLGGTQAFSFFLFTAVCSVRAGSSLTAAAVADQFENAELR